MSNNTQAGFWSVYGWYEIQDEYVQAHYYGRTVAQRRTRYGAEVLKKETMANRVPYETKKKCRHNNTSRIFQEYTIRYR
jgi:hypothetical protein